MSKLFAEEKGCSMAKRNKVVYKDVCRLCWSFFYIALIFGEASFVYADDGKVKNELVRRYVSDGLLIYNELVSESGSNFIKARRIHANLLDIYVREMETRQRDYVAALLTQEALDILAKLNSLKESLAKPVPEDTKDQNAWAKKDIERASKQVGTLLKDHEPYLKEPYDFDGFEKLGNRCRENLYAAMKDVKVKLRAYIQDLTIEKAEELCETNRKAIVLSFMNRFARFEDPRVESETSTNKGLDLRVLRQFRGDINRTIFWNRVLQNRLKGNEKSVLKKYTASEIRRLRVLRAVIGNDMKEAQALLLVAFRDSYPLKANSRK